MAKQNFIPAKNYITEEVIKRYKLIAIPNTVGAEFLTGNITFKIKEGVPDNIELLLFTCHLDNEKSGFDSDLCTLVAFYMKDGKKMMRKDKFSPELFDVESGFTALVNEIIKEVTNE